MRFSRLIPILLLACAFQTGAQTIEKLEQLPGEPLRPMTFEDMYAFGRVSDPQVSPNGKVPPKQPANGQESATPCGCARHAATGRRG